MRLSTDVVFNFEKRIIFVTGGSSGIGKAVASALLRSGARVAALARSESGLQSLAEENSSSADRLLLLPADLTDPTALNRSVDRIVETFGVPDGLVNSVAVNFRKPAFELEEEDLQRTMAVNFHAVFRCCTVIAAKMAESAKSYGPAVRKIVNVASTGAWQGSRNYSSYNASKAALVTATKVFANEWSAYGIGVNAVCPGPTRTPFLEPYYREHPELEKAVVARTPAGRIAEAEDHVGIILFLLSGVSNWIVGDAVISDGGKHLNG